MVNRSNPKTKGVVRKPHPFQKRMVEWNVSHAGSANFADPGAGKSAVMLRSFYALKKAGVAERALIVAPLRVAKEVWPKEPEEWAGSEWDCLRSLKIVVLHGPRKDYLAEQDADVYVINVDGLKWLTENGLYRRFMKMRLDTLIWDESTALKHTRTKRFKLIKPLLPKFRRRWILTGTPVPNGYMDLFGQIYCVDTGRALGAYITHYRTKYFTPLDRMGWNWVLREGAEKEIEDAIAPYVFRLDADDYLQLPELVDNVIRVDLPADVRKIYDEVEEELISEIEAGKIVTAVSAGAARMKCEQIANGGVYYKEELPPLAGDSIEARLAALVPVYAKKTWKHLHMVKVEAVEELIDELSGVPAMVAYQFDHDLERLLTAFPKAPHIGGDNPKEAGRILTGWNRSEYPVLFVQPQTVSHGLNMQKGNAAHIIWHSLTYDREVYDQLIRRLRRQGSAQKRIFNHLIIARNTVDEVKWRAIKKKGTTQKNFLEAMKEYLKERS